MGSLATVTPDLIAAAGIQLVINCASDQTPNVGNVRVENCIVILVFDRGENSTADAFSGLLRLATTCSTLWGCEHGCHRSGLGLGAGLVALGAGGHNEK